MLTHIQRKRAKKRLNRLIFVSFFILVIVVFFVFKKTNQNKIRSIASPLAVKPTVTLAPSPTPLQNSTNLQKVVSDALNGTHGTYGISIKNMKTGESYFAHQTHIFKSGSLYKLWIMAVVFEDIKDGDLKDSDILTESVPELNEKFQIDPTLAEKTEGTITFSVDDALNQMITISDNYAALLLTEKIGLSSVTSFLEKNGFTQSKVGVDGKDPVTTPQDIALFFEKLYKGQIIDKEYSDKMLDLLKQQRLNSKIPKYLPDDISVAHKTGELDEDSHDAGIVYSPGGDYIIVVLSESDSRELANERIADVSQAVYNYFVPSQQ